MQEESCRGGQGTWAGETGGCQHRGGEWVPGTSYRPPGDRLLLGWARVGNEQAPPRRAAAAEPDPHVSTKGLLLQGAQAPIPATTCEPERAGEGLTGRQVSCLPTAQVGVCTQGHEAGLALGVSRPATGQTAHRSGSGGEATAALRPDTLHLSWARGPLRISGTASGHLASL